MLSGASCRGYSAFCKKFPSLVSLDHDLEIARRVASHRGFVRVFWVCRDQDFPAMVMERAEEDLFGALYESPLPLKNIWSLQFQITNALVFMHEAGILHLDIKPENILLFQERRVAKLCDYTSSCSLRTPREDPRAFSAGYIPPERLLFVGNYTPACDVWSLACVFFHIRCSRPLIEENDGIANILYLLGMPCFDDYPVLHHVLDHYNISPSPGTKTREGATVMFLSGVLDQDEADLLEKMFEVHPRDRISARKMLDHPYFSAVGERDKRSDHRLTPKTGQVHYHQDTNFDREYPRVQFTPGSNQRLLELRDTLLRQISSPVESV